MYEKKPVLVAKREGAGASRVLLENQQMWGCPECDLAEAAPACPAAWLLLEKRSFFGCVCVCFIF